MTFPRRTLSLLTFLLTCGCTAITPLYTAQQHLHTSIDIAPIAEHHGQILRTHLERILAPTPPPHQARLEALLSVTTRTALPSSWPYPNTTHITTRVRARLLNRSHDGTWQETTRFNEEQTVSYSHQTHALGQRLVHEDATARALEALAYDIASRLRTLLPTAKPPQTSHHS